jgi:modification methylase
LGKGVIKIKTSHQIIIGDARRMREIPDEAVHLVVTSPPYWQLKDYGKAGQIGFDDTYEAYINNLNLVWQECRRVLHGGCRLCINIGDQFARAVYYGRYKVIPIRTEIIRFCESTGFDYMGAVIWRKVTTCNTTGGAVVMGSYPYPRNGILKLDYEFILIFKKYGSAPAPSPEAKERSRLTAEEWNLYFSGHWQFPGERQHRHLAMFPEELPKRLIRMFSFAGDTVLDPFLGSGTTTLAAKHLGRHSIGYEINQDYLPLIKEKARVSQPDLFTEAAFEISYQPPLDLDIAGMIEKLPCIFKDPVRFDRKADPKRDGYGSRIEKQPPAAREIYLTVKEIISPTLLLLSDGTVLQLLGIREKPEKSAEAIGFLREKTGGQKVFVRFAGNGGGDAGSRSGYLYLKNKTFINAHLLKRGLAEADPGAEHRYKAKFLDYAAQATQSGAKRPQR